jgi:ferredoxin-thioredoxin reductase catalytic subunit
LQLYAVEEEMKVLENLLKGLVVASLVLSVASCCCTGGTDDDPSDTDIVAPGVHNEGTGGDA